MKKIATPLVLAGALAGMSGAAHADMVGVYIGGQAWNMQADGSFGNDTDIQVFDFEEDVMSSAYIAIEHPVPVLPNLKVRYNQVETEGETLLSSEFTYSGQTYAVNTIVDADVDIGNVDYVLYYEILDNDLVSLDIGLNAKHVDGKATVVARDNTSLTSSEEFSGFIPMLYASASVGFPGTGLSLFGDGSFITIGDHTMYDAQIGLSYEAIDNLAVDVSFNIGYRKMKVELDDLDDITTNLDFDGAFVGMQVHF